jgi:hypothetical protein
MFVQFIPRTWNLGGTGFSSTEQKVPRWRGVNSIHTSYTLTSIYNSYPQHNFPASPPDLLANWLTGMELQPMPIVVAIVLSDDDTWNLNWSWNWNQSRSNAVRPHTVSGLLLLQLLLLILLLPGAV